MLVLRVSPSRGIVPVSRSVSRRLAVRASAKVDKKELLGVAEEAANAAKQVGDGYGSQMMTNSTLTFTPPSHR